jgi:hypothetical protein
VRVVANRLAAWLLDIASLGYYISILAKCAAGAIPAEAIVAAYHAATRAKESARKPGAIWVWTLNNWVQPPKPSEVRYYQTRTVQPTADPQTSGPSPEDRERELHELRTMAADPRHPFRRVAAKQLAEKFGIDLTQIGQGQ